MNTAKLGVLSNFNISVRFRGGIDFTLSGKESWFFSTHLHQVVEGLLCKYIHT